MFTGLYLKNAWKCVTLNTWHEQLKNDSKKLKLSLMDTVVTVIRLYECILL